MKKTVLLFSIILSAVYGFTQDGNGMDEETLPYAEIPDYPKNYGPGNILSRLVDGLGYRYYWATEGLTEKELDFKPSEDARSTRQTLEHLYGLSETVLNGAKNKPSIRPADWSNMDFLTLRKSTLFNLKEASDLYANKNEEEIARLKVQFQNEDRINEFPYWHMINGPISDALYHTGQIVSFRRSSGNPMNPKVSVFMGKTRN